MKGWTVILNKEKVVHPRSCTTDFTTRYHPENDSDGHYDTT